jgi:cysteine synthase
VTPKSGEFTVSAEENMITIPFSKKPSNGSGTTLTVTTPIAGFEPATFSRAVVDDILTVEDDAAIKASRQLSAREGLLVGISSGAAYAGALALAREDAYAGKTIVAVLPDTGERYLSTVLFDYQNYPLQ